MASSFKPSPNVTRGNTQASGSSHQLTGSVTISGSLTVNGTPVGGGGGPPGTPLNSVQFNDAGSFGGDAGLTYNKTTDVLTAVDISASSNISASAFYGGSLTTTGNTILGNASSDYHQVSGTLSISGSQPLVVYGPVGAYTGAPSIIARSTASVGEANMWEQPASGALIISADPWDDQPNGAVMYVHSPASAAIIGFKNSSTAVTGIQKNGVTSNGNKGVYVGLQNTDLRMRNHIGNVVFTADGSTELTVSSDGTIIGNSSTDNHQVSGTLHVSGGIIQQQYFSASISTPVNATCSLYNVFNYHLTANSEVTASNPVAGTSYLFFFRQDGTGTRTVDFSGFKWPGGTAPTLSTAAGAVDIVSGISDGTNIYADTTKNFS
tara:strand:+ start:690 stop:1826 length:1137 start_codon:yes stop_codon:yes gene_type:complete